MIYRFYVLSASSDPENYRYVGVTTKRSIMERLYGHRYCALDIKKRNLPVHKWMYSHYQKGEEILIKEIHQCDESLWESEEVRLINEYKKKGFDLLNIQSGGRGVVTKEMRTIDGIIRSAKAHEKPVYAIDKKTMTIVYKFSSITDATKFLGYNSRSSIGNVLAGRTKSCGGYYWVWKSDWDQNICKINNTPDKHGASKDIYQFDLNGNLISKFSSLQEACRNLNIINTSALSKHINKKDSYMGFIWSYSEKINLTEYLSNIFPIQEINNNVLVAQYRTQREISKKYQIPESAICRIIHQNLLLPNGNYLKISKN